MAITRTNKTTSFTSSPTAALSTPSITPTANALVLATVWYARAGSLPVDVPTCSGNGLTWTLVKNLKLGADLDCGVATFAALGAAPSAGPVTFTFANVHGEFLWEIGEYTGPEISATQPYGNVVSAQTAIAVTTASPLTITLGTFSSASNRPYGVGVNRGSTFNGEAAWTSLQADVWSSPVPIFGVSRWHPTVADTTFDLFESGSGTTTPKGGYAFEIGTVPQTTAQLSQLPVEVLRAVDATTVSAQLSQLPVEVLRASDPSLIAAQLSQLPVEILRSPSIDARVTQLVVETLSHEPPPDPRVTQVVVETLTSLTAVPDPRVTQLVVETLTAQPYAFGRVSQLVVETLTKEPYARISQLVAETITSTPVPRAPGQVTQLVTELLFPVPASPVAASQVAAELVLALPPQPNQARVTLLACELIVVRVPCINGDFAVDVVTGPPACPGDFPVD